ncbi:hypothetical protein [Rhodopila sp.]|uniref:hypothetical protein n=1 Tax=Rhodopila sp. TaxID=2480087 RepID=UPI003D106E6C
MQTNVATPSWIVCLMTCKLVAVVALIPSVALAQSVPEKCKHLDVVAYNEEWAQAGKTLVLDAVIQNNDQYKLQYAGFSFNLYLGRNNNKADYVSGSINNLEPGDQTHLKMTTKLQQIDGIKIWSVSCSFIQ